MIALLTSMAPTLTSAHEGHTTPGAAKAAHIGGVTKQTKNLFLELLVEGNELKIYPTDHDSKPVPLDQVKIEATLELPKGTKGGGKLSFSPMTGSDAKESHFMAQVDTKGAHRYTLKVKATYLNIPGEAKFTVEPK